MIYSVRKEEIEQVWPMVEGFIASSCEFSGGMLEAFDILTDLLRGDKQLYICGEAEGCFVTEIITYKQEKAVRVVCLGGKPKACDFGEITDMMLAWAKVLGAKVEMVGRPGWTKVLKKYGWKQTSVIMEVKNGER